MKNSYPLAGLITALLFASSHAAIPTDGLVAYYPFNGNSNDASGNGLNAVGNGPTLTTDRFGKANSAYSFAKTSGYPNTTKFVTNSNLNILGNSSRTVSVWFCLDENSAYKYGNLITWGTDSVGTTFHLTYEPWQELGYKFAIDGGYMKWAWLHTGNLATGVWHHLVVTYATNMGNSKMYLNGSQLVGVSDPRFGNASSTLNTGAGPLHINSYMNEGWGIVGKIDDVRIYNRALSATDAQEIYDVERVSSPYASQCQEQLATLQQKLDAADDLVASLQTQLATANMSISQLRDDKAALEQQIAALNTQLNAKNTEIAKLQNEKDVLNRQLTAKTTELNNAGGQIAQLQSDNAALRQQLTAAEARIATLTTQQIQGLAGLDEIMRLIQLPVGRRSSTVRFTGPEGAKANAIIDALLAPPGQNVNGK